MWAFSSTYAAKVFIQQLDISVQHFQGQQLIILVIQTSAEIQAGVPALYERMEGQVLKQWLQQCCEETRKHYKNIWQHSEESICVFQREEKHVAEEQAHQIKYNLTVLTKEKPLRKLHKGFYVLHSCYFVHSH